MHAAQNVVPNDGRNALLLAAMSQDKLIDEPPIAKNVVKRAISSARSVGLKRNSALQSAGLFIAMQTVNAAPYIVSRIGSAVPFTANPIAKSPLSIASATTVCAQGNHNVVCVMLMVRTSVEHNVQHALSVPPTKPIARNVPVATNNAYNAPNARSKDLPIVTA